MGEGSPEIFEPGYMLYIFFFFFLKPSDRISLPLLAQIRFFFFLVGEGVEQVVGNGTVRLNYHYKMIQCQISVLHILVFQGRSVLCVVLFTWLNLGCNNYFS